MALTQLTVVLWQQFRPSVSSTDSVGAGVVCFFSSIIHHMLPTGALLICMDSSIPECLCCVVPYESIDFIISLYSLVFLICIHPQH